eukprot:128701-Prymnesium_polylepis.2
MGLSIAIDSAAQLTFDLALGSVVLRLDVHYMLQWQDERLATSHCRQVLGHILSLEVREAAPRLLYASAAHLAGAHTLVVGPPTHTRSAPTHSHTLADRGCAHRLFTALVSVPPHDTCAAGPRAEWRHGQRERARALLGAAAAAGRCKRDSRLLVLRAC